VFIFSFSSCVKFRANCEKLHALLKYKKHVLDVLIFELREKSVDNEVQLF